MACFLSLWPREVTAFSGMRNIEASLRAEKGTAIAVQHRTALSRGAAARGVKSR